MSAHPNDERAIALLTEIRDVQREAVEFSRAQARQVEALVARQIANQETAIRSQLATARLYRAVVLVMVPLLVGVLGYLVYKILPHL